MVAVAVATQQAAAATEACGHIKFVGVDVGSYSNGGPMYHVPETIHSSYCLDELDKRSHLGFVLVTIPVLASTLEII